jgi:hypothetical protein
MHMEGLIKAAPEWVLHAVVFSALAAATVAVFMI